MAIDIAFACAAFKSEAVVFERDHLLFDNIVCRRINDPAIFLKEFEVSGQYKTTDWMIDQVVGILKYLGRRGEAKRAMKLKRG
ncbi:MAG: hypothetical protein NWE89_03505 [Candidatus Bathyarchaeota archaeon]|nr:hypothetical protein [Candidatus Bathyarchaeota archaeon]